MNWLLVFLGGGMGSLARYAVSVMLARSTSSFPWATLLANILSCVLLGAMVALLMRSEQVDPSWKYLWMIGFCGGFSTFSTFTGETFQLLQDGQIGLALLNIMGSVVVCLLAFYLGYKMVA